MKKKLALALAVLLLTGSMTIQNADAAPVSENGFVPLEAGQEENTDQAGSVGSGEAEGTEEDPKADQTLCPYVECLDTALYHTYDSEMAEESAAPTRYLFLGDSTVCGYKDKSGNDIYSYVHFFQQRRSADVTNAAIGGATYSSRWGHNINYELDQVDISAYDVAFFQFGVNDFTRAYPLGRVDSTNTYELCGAMNTAIRRLRNKGVECYCILPFYYRSQFDPIKNENGQTFEQYLDAIKRVCERNHITIIDFNTAFGIDGSNFWDYYIDNVHPGGVLQQRAGIYLDEYMKVYDDVAQIEAFVDRLYNLCLSRQPDEGGMQDWKEALIKREKSGAVVAYGFFFSDEMKNRNLSDKEFVELLYRVMMDREYDEGGREYWVGRLEAGVSREGVYKGFAESAEFTQICGAYGIERGSVSVSESRDLNTGLTMFVSRLYTKALGRSYDVGGLNDWCGRILNHTWSVTDVATNGFFESEEFINKNLNDEDYVKVLYETFLGREYDEEGLADWTNKLKDGEMSREEVLRGFSDSEEFATLMKEYGL